MYNVTLKIAGSFILFTC